MIRILSFFLLWFICMGICCTQKEETTTDNKMVLIISDLLIADELIVKYGRNEKAEFQDILRRNILEIHDLEESQLDSILIQIQSDLEYYHKIQDKVKDHLNELKEIHMKTKA